MNDQLKVKCIRLMNSAQAAILTTVDGDGFPCTRAMLNLRNTEMYPGLKTFFKKMDDTLSTYFTTNTSSEKMQQIQNNNRVSVYYCNPESFHGVMLSGRIEIIEDMNVKKSLWQKEWTVYCPDGVEDPDNAVLRLRPDSIRGWSGSDTFELSLNHGV